ncbi:hypothetical protein C8E95_6131 [Pseudonocardia autotrophica]|uniref:Uncharacterized protein n=1 Tax=Pseudonocardia autotrophica TaxID=2074 RepID=A0A1Y2MK63_PSEAH|nr:hypothetical protein BG845_05955 [Pseudonocardia autotrophica]TDN76911.1 hypothetical protein C8E95_6131 [Pseudonocardia autotrophica]
MIGVRVGDREPGRIRVATAETVTARISVVNTKARTLCATTVRRISRVVTVTSPVPNEVLTPTVTSSR